MDLLVAVPIGVLVGAVLGLLGAGGSLLTVPALIFLLGLSTGEATGTSLVAVTMMAVAGVVVHRRAGRCSCKEGFAFGGAAAVTAAAAGWAASALPERILTGAFVVLLVGTAVWLLQRSPEAEDDSRDPGDRQASGGILVTGAAGGGIGVLTGLLGVGGGFLIVPALLVTRNMRMSMAVGTSQLVVLISAVAGLAGRATGDTVQWALGLLFGLGGLVGATIGSRLADRAPEAALRTGFAAVAVAVAGLMGWQVVQGGTLAA